MENDELVIVASFFNIPDAYILKGKLETEGIPAVVNDEEMVSVNPFYSTALGGVKVRVLQKDYEKAREIYMAFENDLPEEDENE